MRRSNWPSDKTAVLLALVDEGLDRRDIAARMGVIVNAVTTKLYTLGLIVPLESSAPPAPTVDPALGHLLEHPRFEDITSKEAAAVRRGSAPSAIPPRPTFHDDRSLTGSTAALCTL